MFQQLILFAGIGAVGTAAHYALLIVLVAGTVSPLLASTVGATAGALINYLLNYRYTFRSSRSHIAALPRFFLVAASAIVLNGLVLQGLMSALLLHYLPAQLLATLAVLSWTFSINRVWTFREGASHAE